MTFLMLWKQVSRWRRKRNVFESLADFLIDDRIANELKTKSAVIVFPTQGFLLCCFMN